MLLRTSAVLSLAAYGLHRSQGLSVPEKLVCDLDFDELRRPAADCGCRSETDTVFQNSPSEICGTGSPLFRSRRPEEHRHVPGHIVIMVEKAQDME